jgi:hypothetical protein
MAIKNKNSNNRREMEQKGSKKLMDNKKCSIEKYKRNKKNLVAIQTGKRYDYLLYNVLLSLIVIVRFSNEHIYRPHGMPNTHTKSHTHVELK